jgi:hypothetical protein
LILSKDISRCQLPSSAAWSEDRLIRSFPPIKHVVRPVVRCFEVHLQTMSKQKFMHVPEGIRHSGATAAQIPNSPLAGASSTILRLCRCRRQPNSYVPLPLCSAFTYYRLCDTFILLGVLSRIWNINLNAFSQKGSDVGDLPFKPRLRPLECGEKQGTACHFRFTSLHPF